MWGWVCVGWQGVCVVEELVGPLCLHLNFNACIYIALIQYWSKQAIYIQNSISLSLEYVSCLTTYNVHAYYMSSMLLNGPFRTQQLPNVLRSKSLVSLLYLTTQGYKHVGNSGVRSNGPMIRTCTAHINRICSHRDHPGPMTVCQKYLSHLGTRCFWLVKIARGATRMSRGVSGSSKNSRN